MDVAEIAIRVQSRAARDELLVGSEGQLRVRVTAPALDGRANRATCRLIARRLGVAPSRVAIVRGEHSREKVIRVEGVDPQALRAVLGC